MLTAADRERLRVVVREVNATHSAGAACDQTCSWCAKNWFTWLKDRLDQMSEPQRKKKAWTDKFGKFHPE